MSFQAAPSRPLITIRDSVSLQEAAHLMCDMSRGALGVHDTNREFLGLITERDLLWAQARGLDPGETSISEIVNDFPIIVEGPLSVDAAASRMIAGHVRHLLVREYGALQIVAMRDILVKYLDGSPGDFGRPASLSELRHMFGSAFENPELGSRVAGSTHE